MTARLWFRDPRPMNDEWLREEIADCHLMLENLERRRKELDEDSAAYLAQLQRLEAEQARRRGDRVVA